jgi:DNA-binding CsgD family transcriptional regulator
MPRQAMILHLYNAGFHTKHIATVLNITVHTLYQHLKGIYYKFDVHNIDDAIEKGINVYYKPKTGGPVNQNLTMRDYFAAKALEGYLVAPDLGWDYAQVATASYKMADEMLKAREKRKREMSA